MKTLNIIPLFIFTLIFILAQSAFGLDDKYQEAMKKNIASVYNAQTAQARQEAVNAFDRIGSAEKTKWEPFYYSAFGNTMLAVNEQEAAKKDQYLDLAMAAVEKAKAVAPAESEVIAMEGFIYSIRITVDPKSRGAQFSGQAMQTLGKAVGLNPENPRALAMLAQMQHGTAQFFGSSTAEACATVNKSLEKFDTYKSDNPLAPQWGKSMAEKLKGQCK